MKIKIRKSKMRRKKNNEMKYLLSIMIIIKCWINRTEKNNCENGKIDNPKIWRRNRRTRRKTHLRKGTNEQMNRQPDRRAHPKKTHTHSIASAINDVIQVR